MGIFHGDRGWRVVVFGLGTPPVNGRFVDVFREEPFETLGGSEFFHDVTSIEATVGAVTDRAKAGSAKTDFQTVNALEGNSEQSRGLRNDAEGEDGDFGGLEDRQVWDDGKLRDGTERLVGFMQQVDDLG